MFIKWISWKHCETGKCLEIKMAHIAIIYDIRGLLEKYPTFGREKETGLLGALDT